MNKNGLEVKAVCVNSGVGEAKEDEVEKAASLR
jgi:hypothetical protein